MDKIPAKRKESRCFYRATSGLGPPHLEPQAQRCRESRPSGCQGCLEVGSRGTRDHGSGRRARGRRHAREHGKCPSAFRESVPLPGAPGLTSEPEGGAGQQGFTPPVQHVRKDHVWHMKRYRQVATSRVSGTTDQRQAAEGRATPLLTPGPPTACSCSRVLDARRDSEGANWGLRPA